MFSCSSDCGRQDCSSSTRLGDSGRSSPHLAPHDRQHRRPLAGLAQQERGGLLRDLAEVFEPGPDVALGDVAARQRVVRQRLLEQVVASLRAARAERDAARQG